MKKIALLALIAGTSSAMASTSTFSTVGSVTFTNKASVDAQGDTDNAIASWVSAAGGNVSSVRVTGLLREVNTGTFASEARVRITAGAGNSFSGFNIQASTVGDYVGTQAVGPTAFGVTPFTVGAGSTLNFEWFESFQDDANLPEQVWDTVTYEFGGNNIVNGSFGLGAANPNGVTSSTAGLNVSRGLDFYTITIPYGVSNLADYLNIKTSQPAGAASYDSELAIFDSAGNKIAEDDDGVVGAGAAGFYSMLSFGAADPLAAPGANAETNPGESGASLAAGTYTIVVGGFDTVFGANINTITPGAAAGAYSLDVTYVPAPASIAFLGLGALVGGRRRR
ncbi:MAG: hypothetical protein NTV94_04700 [Planctomycetota bacterium]|nr:hypothetical protein [Planctomycetota bacterium]